MTDDDAAQPQLDRTALLIELRAILDDVRPSSAITSAHLDALNRGPLWQRAAGPVIVSDPAAPLSPAISVD
jgi:hypothetical protein